MWNLRMNNIQTDLVNTFFLMKFGQLFICFKRLINIVIEP
jgi:hypothetical protein